MKENNRLKIKKFIDKNFGDEIQYCWIKDNKYNVLIYSSENRSIIFRIRNMDHLLQELIMLKEERDYLLKENLKITEELERMNKK